MTPSSTNRTGSPANATSDEHPTVSPSLWRLDTIPEKDKALIATQDITPGTLLLSDPPLLTTDCITSTERTEKDIARALRALPKESQKAFLALHNNYPREKNPFSKHHQIKWLPTWPRIRAGGVFANISRINHSCCPNAKHSRNDILKQQTVYALRPISAGEEIIVSYLAGGSSEERQEVLKTHFRFACKGELCPLPPEKLRASDSRIIRAQHLSEGIEDEDSQTKSPTKLLKNGLQLLRIYDEEVIRDDRLGNLYWEMFKIANKHRDQARASVFAQLYSDSKLLSEGPQSANVLEMMGLIKKPEKDRSFGQAIKRKAAMRLKEEDLSGFEDTDG